MVTLSKERYGQPRQHIKKQRHYFANKSVSGQGYGFSSGHVWMWELDCEESWARRIWCFWTVMLEKTLESPLECREFQSVHLKGDQSWAFIGWTDWISLQSKGLSRVFSNTTVQKNQYFSTQLSLYFNTHIHTWTTGRTIALTRWTFVGKVMSLLFNMLCRSVIAFLPRSKHLLISWLQSPSAEILEPPKVKSVTVSIVSPSICPEVMGSDAMILVFCMLSFQPNFFTLLLCFHWVAL